MQKEKIKMIENVLERKNLSLRVKVTVKALIAAGIVALAVVLPQIAHLAVGAQAGVMLLPMYLPVLLGGCVLGFRWGLGVGLLSPLASYLITSALGNPMPAAARLPLMMAELAVFASVAGLFSNIISEKPLAAVPAVLLAQLCGRSFFLLLVVVFQNVLPFSPAMILAQIKSGIPGLLIQAVFVPLAVVLLTKLLDGSKND